MIPYPCWDPSATAVKIRTVASCIALPLIPPLYTDELTMSIAEIGVQWGRWGCQAGRVKRLTSGSIPAAEAAFAVDDLAGDPGRLVRDQPGDQAGGGLGDGPARMRGEAAGRPAGPGAGVARVGRARRRR